MSLTANIRTCFINRGLFYDPPTDPFTYLSDGLRRDKYLLESSFKPGRFTFVNTEKLLNCYPVHRELLQRVSKGNAELQSMLVHLCGLGEEHLAKIISDYAAEPLIVTNDGNPNFDITQVLSEGRICEFRFIGPMYDETHQVLVNGDEVACAWVDKAVDKSMALLDLTKDTSNRIYEYVSAETFLSRLPADSERTILTEFLIATLDLDAQRINLIMEKILLRKATWRAISSDLPFRGPLRMALETRNREIVQAVYQRVLEDNRHHQKDDNQTLLSAIKVGEYDDFIKVFASGFYLKNSEELQEKVAKARDGLTSHKDRFRRYSVTIKKLDRQAFIDYLPLLFENEEKPKTTNSCCSVQ